MLRLDQGGSVFAFAGTLSVPVVLALASAWGVLKPWTPRPAER
ncbi:hypothetical protein [Trebonia kvetii]|nr:hypothetical protein [Trebonia kvetii]